MFLPFVLFLHAFSLPLATEALATPRKSHVGLRPTHFFVYKPLRERSSRRTPTAKGISRISSAFSLPLATEALATPRKSHVGLRPTHFFVYKPLRKQSSRGTPTGRGISRISSAFSLPLAAEALATPRKSHVGLRPTHFFVYKPLRKQSSRGAYIRKKPNLKLGFCLCCGERGIRKAKPSRGHISKNNPYLATQPPLRENPLEKAAAGIAAFCCGTERPSCCSDDLLETKKRQTSVCHCGRFRLAEREALEPTYSRNIIKLQIINNQALFGVHSKSKSF